jgi:serine/threonine-protein kinase
MQDEAEPPLPPGTDVGSYTIVRRVGAGAFGTVYEAVRQPLRKRVALKVLHATGCRSGDTVARFLREAEAAARLRHPNVIEVYDCGEAGASPYIAMEFLEGEALDERIRRKGRLSLRETADIALPIISAIAAVHGHGIVHRDLKPANIFLTAGPRGEVPKLLDFGIAKVRDARVDLTRSSSMVGTPLYMSPEQARESKHVDERSDVWSLGAILFECLTGERAFGAPTLLEVLERITRANIPRARATAPDLPPELDALLLRMLERDVALRLADVREVGRVLLPYASERPRLDFVQEFGDALPTVEINQAVPLPMSPTPSAGTLSAEVQSVPGRPEHRRLTGAAAVLVAFGAAASVAFTLLAQRAPRQQPVRPAAISEGPPVPTAPLPQGSSRAPATDGNAPAAGPFPVVMPPPAREVELAAPSAGAHDVGAPRASRSERPDSGVAARSSASTARSPRSEGRAGATDAEAAPAPRESASQTSNGVPNL